jgi:hypothetical protein
LAKEGAEKDVPDDLPLDIPPEYDLQGAKLATMTQALAHQGIRTKITPTPRPTTTRNLEQVKSAIQNFSLSHETDAAVWKGLRRRSIRPRVQQFLYKTIHGAYKIGSFWTRIPGYETRGQCPRCNTTENMDHILTTCTAEPVSLIWNLARVTWPHAPELWPDTNLGIILAGGILTTPVEEEHEQGDEEDSEERAQRRNAKRGMDRLLQILVSESAHLIIAIFSRKLQCNVTHHSNRDDFVAR